MRPSVSVPVLSEASTVTEPRVSTAGSQRTSAECRAIRNAPMASATDTTAGKDSGMAATARLTASTTISAASSPRSSPSTKTNPASASVSMTSCRESRDRRCCSGVGRETVVTSADAIWPRPLSAPVRSICASPRPVVDDSSGEHLLALTSCHRHRLAGHRSLVELEGDGFDQ